MDERLRRDAEDILRESIRAVAPDEAVRRALGDFTPGAGQVVLVAAGKAAWPMARTAVELLGRVDRGIVITKYGHVPGEIPGVVCREAGHPVPDENGFAATREALDLTGDLGPEDRVVFLLSGGGSALFEASLLPGAELQDVTRQLLASGANIVEMNTVRKRLSGVKGGRFARHCAPAGVFAVVLSDVLGDPLDMIASGPACPDPTTCAQAAAVAEKYGLRLSARGQALLAQETPKVLDNVEVRITGSVRELCAAAAAVCARKGYRPLVLTDRLDCEAREAGRFLAAMARSREHDPEPAALLAGGETVVHVAGTGLGGRCQELVLGAAEGIRGMARCVISAFGSDGTDGPTDAAGGWVDGTTAERLEARGISVHEALRNNDAYHALDAVGGLWFTGPTGTNVNDLAMVLLGGDREG